MFESVSVLLSLVYAVALTHLLTSATELIWARDRVRFSGLFAIWFLVGGLNVVSNWLSFGGLSGMKHWTTLEAMLQFTMAAVQYFTCSLISIRPKEDGVIDLPAFYARQRRPIMIAWLALAMVACVLNIRDAEQTAGLVANSWIAENAAVLVMALMVGIAGWARPVRLQWAAAIGMLALSIYFLTLYAVPG
jgi:hypothetical protein